MDVPIYIDGQEAGRLRAEREGLYTRLRAECDMREGLTRLWLHGGGESRYLGLLAPEGGQLTLAKRLSRAALPKAIEYASDGPEGNSEFGIRSSELSDGMPAGADDPGGPENGDRGGDGGRPGAAAPTATNVHLSVGADALGGPGDVDRGGEEEGERIATASVRTGFAMTGKDDRHPISPNSEFRTPDSEFLLLPCRPGVPGATQIGGRWVLVISPPGRYNNDIGW